MVGMIKLIAVVVGLLFMVPDTMQLHVNHPLHAVVDRLTAEAGSYLGLVISSSGDQNLLTNSTDYEPNLSIPYIIFAGRTFTFGTFKNELVIHVLAGKPMANVAATVQMMIDLFPIKGIINYGSAATVSNQVIIADVVIPSQVAFTGVWSWEDSEARVRFPSLKIGDYNVPDVRNVKRERSYLICNVEESWRERNHFPKVDRAPHRYTRLLGNSTSRITRLPRLRCTPDLQIENHPNTVQKEGDGAKLRKLQNGSVL